MTKILLVDDDSEIVNYLIRFLAKEGYSVENVAGQKAALEKMARGRYDLVLLDISLSDGNGFALCRAIKAEYRLPVIFLTASGDEYSTVTGFDLGADDYIAKPFRPRELVSRIKNVLRLVKSGNTLVRLGGVTVDTVRGIAQKDGRDLCLSALEYRLLLVFLNNLGAVLTRGQLLDAIWDACGEYVNDNTLTVYIKRLRDKIEDDPQNPKFIKTVRRMGYRMDAE